MLDSELMFADVSVVIPCYRCRNTIERALNSIFEQSLRPKEVILIDDCSDDGTLEYLIDLQKKYSSGWVKVIGSKVNAGPATARNIGWNIAVGKYIAFLDSDDSWHPEKIRIQYDWMLRNDNAGLTGQSFDGDYQAIEAKTVLDASDTFYAVSLQSLLRSNKFTTSSVMLLTSIQERFKDRVRYCEDYLLWSKICSSGYECFSINFPLSVAYKPVYGSSGLSSNLWKMELGELYVYRVMLKDGAINYFSCFYYVSWSLLRFFRRIIKSIFGLV